MGTPILGNLHVEFTHGKLVPSLPSLPSLPSGMHCSIDKSQVLALIVGQSASWQAGPSL